MKHLNELISKIKKLLEEKPFVIELFVALFLFAVTLCFFWKVCFTGKTFIAGDLLTYIGPNRYYAAQMIRKGQVPLWNPLIFSGAPFLANVQNAVFYPPNILFYIFSLPTALVLSVLLHIFLAAWFMYLFCKKALEMSTTGSIFAAAAFAFGGFFLNHVGLLNQLHTACWIPLVFLCFHLAIRHKSIVWALTTGLIIGVQFLAGHTEEFAYMMFALFLYLIYLTLIAFKESPKETGRIFVLYCIALIFSGVLVAVQIIPTYEVYQYSLRSGGLTYEKATAFSLPAKIAVNSVLPDYANLTYGENVAHVGVCALILALLGVIFAFKRPPVSFLLPLGAAACFFSLGSHNPLFKYFFYYVPVFKFFRVPSRWLYLFTFSAAVIGGIGLDGLSNLRERRKTLITAKFVVLVTVATGAILLRMPGLPLYTYAAQNWNNWILTSLGVIVILLLFLWRNISAEIPKILLIFLLLFELFSARRNMEFNHPLPSSIYTRPPAAAAYIAKNNPKGRILGVAAHSFSLPNEKSTRESLVKKIGTTEADWFLLYTKIKEVVKPNLNMNYGIASLVGYDGGVLPLTRYEELQLIFLPAEVANGMAYVAENTVPVRDFKFLQLLNVEYLVTNCLSEEQVLKLSSEGYNKVFEGNVEVFRTANVLPRAFVVHKARVIRDKDKRLKAIRSSSFTPSQEVILEETVPKDIKTSNSDSNSQDKVTIIKSDAHQTSVSVSLEKDGFLVLSDTFFPGWEAYVDGKREKIYQADHFIRAVPLKKGKHRVRFVFNPITYRLGLIISSCALIFFLLVMGVIFLNKIKKGQLKR
jgi:uncharacterized membrane protein YfhO